MYQSPPTPLALQWEAKNVNLLWDDWKCINPLLPPLALQWEAKNTNLLWDDWKCVNPLLPPLALQWEAKNANLLWDDWKCVNPLLPPLNADKIRRHQGETMYSLPLLVFDDKNVGIKGRLYVVYLRCIRWQKRRYREDLFLTPLVPELSFPAHAAFFQV